MDRIRDIVGGRPVGILLHGRSVGRMEAGIQAVAPESVCWVSLNMFTIVEQGILDRIGDRLSIVALFSEKELPRRYVNIIQFLQRGDDNLLITSAHILSKIPDYTWFIQSFREKLYLSEGLSVPWRAPRKCNSVALLLNDLVAAGVEEIHVYGMDGVKLSATPSEEKASYYGNFQAEKWIRYTSIGKDTEDFNQAFPDVLAYWRDRGREARILNHNPDSYITVFPRVP